MLLVDLLGWWYSHGWVWALHSVFVEKMQGIANFFSITDLLKTLFAPFRQDSLNIKNAPLNIKLRAFVENIISRCFGFIIRSALIFVGLFVLLLNAIFGAIFALLWPVIPLAPIVAIILVTRGVGQ